MRWRLLPSAPDFCFAPGVFSGPPRASKQTGLAVSSLPSPSSISSRYSARFGSNMALDLEDKRKEEPSGHEDAPGAPIDEAKRRQRLRSMAIAWALFALAVMFFLVTIVRLGANVANRPI